MKPAFDDLQRREIPQAEQFVKNGARLLEEQRVRLTQVHGPQSRQLLRTMEETQTLHEYHLSVLRQELAEKRPNRPLP